MVRDLTRDDHRLHLEQMTLNIQSDQKPFWRWLKAQRMGRPSIPALSINGHTLTNLIDKANALNNYFVSVFTKEDPGGNPKLRHELSASRSTESINNLSITNEEVYKALCKLNPNISGGPDQIPGRLLKEGAQWLAEPLANLYNISLLNSELPIWTG